MEALTWVLGGIALVNFLAAAAVYLRGSRDKGTIETLTRSNDALQENNIILTDRVTLLEGNGRTQAAEIEGLKSANTVLTNTVNSSALIEQLRGDLEAHHVAAMAGQKEIHADLKVLPKNIATAIKEEP